MMPLHSSTQVLDFDDKTYYLRLLFSIKSLCRVIPESNANVSFLLIKQLSGKYVYVCEIFKEINPFIMQAIYHLLVILNNMES